MDDETKYPSVDLAYNLAVKSYDIIQQRWDAMNSLFHALLSVVITLTLAIPILAKTLNLPLGMYWAIATIGIFTLSAGCCLFGRLFKSLAVLSSPLKNYLSTHINGKDAWSAGRINQGKEIEQETLIRG